jgi:hypothetical protein
MQETQDANHEGAPVGQAYRTEGVVENPDRVELKTPGAESSVGYCDGFALTKGLVTDGVQWEKIEIPELTLNQTSAILVTQGMLLQDLFARHSWFIDKKRGDVLAVGPFYLLKATLTSPASPPLRLRGIVLAGVLQYPEGMKKMDVLGKLLQAVQ